MRTIPGAWLSEVGAAREVNARVTFRDTRLVFSLTGHTETVTPTVSDVGKTDGALSGTGFLRIASDDTNLWYQYVVDPTLATWPNWTNSNITLNAASKPGVEGDRIWYQGSDGSIYYVNFNGTDLDIPVYIDAGDTSWRMAFAPISTTECYVHWFPYVSDLDTNYGQLAHLTSAGAWSHMPGAVYSDKTDVYRFDAVTLSGADYVYTSDYKSGRVITYKVIGNNWSDAQPLIPMDVVDDTYFFNLGTASVIDGKVFVTGRMSRGQGIQMDIYAIGPDHYTFGRDMFIVSNLEFQSDQCAKLYLVGDTIYYIGFDYHADASATNLIGYDATALKLQTSEIMGFNASFSPNQSSSLNLNLKADLSHAAIRKNAELLLEVGIADGDSSWEWATLGTYGVDGLATGLYDEGIDKAIISRSAASKRLSQWESDAFYDYWSQAGQVSDPAEMTEVIRTAGKWEVNDGDGDAPLYEERLNEEGVLYTASKSSRGGIIKAKFRKDSSVSDYEPLYGIALNYYRENRQQAATRLDKAPGDVQEEEFGHNGLIALWGDDQHSGGAGIAVYRWNASVMTLLSSASLAIPNDTWHWLQIGFHEGQVRVLYQLDSSTDWTEALNFRYETSGSVDGPWANEGRGRGAIYMMDRTVAAETTGFSSTSQIIPVDDNSLFPVSETVIVDSEQITYSSKSPNVAGPGQKTVVTGYTSIYADHNNADWVNILAFFQSQDWVAETGEVTVGKATNEPIYAGTAFKGPYGLLRADTVRIPIKKVGTPGNLYLYFVTDSFDNTGTPVQSAIVWTAQVAHTAVGTDYAWVDFDITGVTESTRTVDPDYTKNHWLFATTMPPGSTAYGSYVDNSNYYMVRMDESLAGNLGIFRIWRSSGYVGSIGWDSYQDLGNANDAVMPFEIYGVSNQGNGNEIYLNGADTATAKDYYEDMALVIVDGPGKGACFTITDYDAQAPAQWVPNRAYLAPDNWQDHLGEAGHGSWVDQDLSRVFVQESIAGKISPDSIVEIHPALVISDRGVDSTVPTSHGAGTVSVYRDVDVEIDLVEYFSSEMDMRLEDMAQELCRKAGVLDFSCEKDLEGVQAFTGAGWGDPMWLERRNLILKFEAPTLDDTDEVGVVCRTLEEPTDIDNVTQGYIATLAYEAPDYVLKYYKWDSTAWVLQERFFLDEDPTGTITISVQEYWISFWINDKFVHAFTDVDYDYGTHAGLIAYGSVSVDVDWSALDIRQDNFVLDMGHRGMQLMNGLIGPKRIFFMDDQTGGIRMGRMRSSGAADYAPPDYDIQRANTVLDAEQVSRVRAEGAEIAEVADFTTLREEGNLFKLINATEANDYWETYDEGQAILEDAASTSNIISPLGFADPRIEPQDIIETTGGDIIVDGVRFTLRQDLDKAVFDIDIEGRDASP